MLWPSGFSHCTVWSVKARISEEYIILNVKIEVVISTNIGLQMSHCHDQNTSTEL